MAISIDIGISGKKAHKFDLGNDQEKVIVECKAHTWTEGGNLVLRDFSKKRNETLAEYYVRTNPHLIPDKVEVWEYDAALQTARRVAIPGR